MSWNTGDGCPEVSVIVAVFNGAGTLGACLDALLALNYPAGRLEIIVVDNASTDATPALLLAYGDKIRVGFELKRGAGAARNHGIGLARYDLVAFTDADCEVEPDWLLHLVAPLVDSQDVAISGGMILARRPFNRVEAFGEMIHDHRAVLEGRIPTAISMNWASPKAMLIEAGGFDEDFLRAQDSDLSYRLFLAGFRFVYAPGAILFHRNERTLLGLFREGFQHGHGGVRFARKHAESLQCLGYRRIPLHSWQNLGRYCKTIVVGGDRFQALLLLVFNLGKKCGRIAGSIRFRHVVL